MPIAANDCRWAKRLLAGAKHVLCVSHARPDGDAIGSVLGLRALIQQTGVNATAVMLDPLPSRYDWLNADGSVLIWSGQEADVRKLSFDAVAIVDTCASRQLEPILPFLEELAVPRVVFDHHATRDLVADVLLMDESAAAACQLVYEWAVTVNLAVDRNAAEPLFTGLATDTGWFRFPSVDTRCIRVAEALVSAGVRPHEIYERLYQQERAAKLRLKGEMLRTLDVRAGGRLAVVSLDKAAFERSDATDKDTEELVNEPQQIAGVEVVLLFVDSGDGMTRVSFRSKGGFDVAAAAAAYGGGGHRQAAGARVEGALHDVMPKVIEKIEAALG